MSSQKNSHIDLSERKILLRFFDILMVVSSLFVSYYFLDFRYFDFSKNRISLWLLTLLVYISFLGEIFQLYNLNVSNNRYQVVRSIIITTFVTTLLYIFTPIIAPKLPENRIQVVYFFIIITLPLLIWRFLYIILLFSPKYFKTILLIGSKERIEKLLPVIEDYKLHNLENYITSSAIDDYKDKYINIDDVNLKKLMKNNLATEIVVSSQGLPEDIVRQLNKSLIRLFRRGINIKSFETYYEEITNSVPKEYLNHNFYKNIRFSRNNESRLYLSIRRILDIVLALIGSGFFMLCVPFVLIGNLIGNRGPLFYRQERVGKGGKPFKIFKLRSMVTDAEKHGAVWAQKNDARITKFGKFLRLTRLDELPQFFNIIRGDMSFIGPRPERPKFVKELAKEIPFYTIRNVIKPGLTGWAQVNFTYANTIEEQETKLRYDLYYIKNRGLFIDFKIIIKTITTVLFMRGQ